MKELLERDFATSYGLNRQVKVEAETKSDSFGETDGKACNDCVLEKFKGCKEKVVSWHHSDTSVEIIQLENFFRQFGNKPEIAGRGCCDRLMCTSKQIVVMDMTCCYSKYLDTHTIDGSDVIGKREKAYQQMAESIEKLKHCQSIDQELNSYKQRIALFAFRKKNTETESDAEKGMKSFMKMYDDFASRTDLQTDMGNGFKFVIQEYPSVFEWM